MKYDGNIVTATRYHYALVGNDFEQTYQIIDTLNGQVIYQNDDEEECLKILFEKGNNNGTN